MSPARLPGAPDRTDRVVCHVDMDCFYASCERRREPTLRGEPVVVGMGYESGASHGAVATASYEARAYGVESAMPISEALERLPRKIEAARDDDLDVEEAAFYRSVDMDYYQSVGEEVKTVLREAGDTVREVSIDEAYLDVTETVGWDEAQAFARDLKIQIEAMAGVPASIGIAPDMSTAKVASDHDKPDGLVIVEPDQVRDFLAPLPVEALHGVGPVRASVLTEQGIETVGDLANTDEETLERQFGERGPELYHRARGNDAREVEPVGRPKSLSRESAFGGTSADHDAVRERASQLAADVAERAAAKGALYRTIGVKIVTPPYDVNTRARSLPGPVDDPELVEDVALDLLTEFQDARVRKVGVRVSNLSFAAADQASLDTWLPGRAAGGGRNRDIDPTDKLRELRGQTEISDFE